MLPPKRTKFVCFLTPLSINVKIAKRDGHGKMTNGHGKVMEEYFVKSVGTLTYPSFLVVYFQDEVRSQDKVFVIAGVTGSVKGRELAWSYVKEKWSYFHDQYKGGFLLSRLVRVSNRTPGSSLHRKNDQQDFLSRKTQEIWILKPT